MKIGDLEQMEAERDLAKARGWKNICRDSQGRLVGTFSHHTGVMFIPQWARSMIACGDLMFELDIYPEHVDVNSFAVFHGDRIISRVTISEFKSKTAAFMYCVVMAAMIRLGEAVNA